MHYWIKIVLVWLLWMPCPAGFCQAPSFNFHQLSTSNGLSDPAIRSITQDKYGYIWIGTINGLNRFNGYEVKVFQHILNDSSSLPENFVPALFSDDSGILWVAEPKGLYQYDYRHNRFVLYPGTTSLSVTKMVKAGTDSICMATNEGLVFFNTRKGTFTRLKDKSDNSTKQLLSVPFNDFCLTGDGLICIASDTGLVKYTIATARAVLIPIPVLKEIAFGKIAIDSAKNLWICYGDKKPVLIKIAPDFGKQTLYEQFYVSNSNLRDNRITSIFSDSKGRLWICAARNGLCLYDAAADSFIQYEHDPLQASSISDNLINVVFQDREGLIWLGTEVTGVNYFDADKTLFHIIQPSYHQKVTLPDYWCRAAGEDAAGNLWLGTGSGIARYNPQKNAYTVFQNTADKKNVIHYNSIRSVLCDGDTVWIGTASGVNRYHISTGKMDFLGDKEQLPLSFFWSIMKDHEGNIWFGCRDGIYRYNKKTNVIENFNNDAVLSKYARYNTLTIYEDSRKRIWFGFYSRGMLMYDAAAQTTRYWAKNLAKPGSLSNNHVISITEDKIGVIWAATLEGLNAWHPQQDSFAHYLHGPGRASENTAGLLTDNQNRLWFAGSKNLYMLDSARRFFTSFDMSNGLPTVDFNYQAAFRSHTGDFVYPTLRGFIQFNPDKYSAQNNISHAYISAFNVYGETAESFINIEETARISLPVNKNFFSLEMIALNYSNPKAIWYAHRLEPFDKEWIYSQERVVNYTNVPGGDYVFHYKTSADKNNWLTPEKTMLIHLDTIFYKTWWFRLLVLALAAAAIYGLYKYRLAQREKVYTLQSKASALEKEKVLVMYESLKQQLNPHFLFNSLTSLSGLITSNPANAKQFLERMSKIYRYILKSRDNETVALTEEIKLAETYTQLQQTRFKEALQVYFNIPEEYLYRKIAPVTIQNLIENAIKHNVIGMDHPLVIHIFIQNDLLVVQNNMQKKKFVETSNRHGLASLQSLYHYLSGQPVAIIEDNHFFTVKIPLI